MRPARIGLRVISSLGWQGGVNYVMNWARACASAPAAERPEIWLLPFDARGEEIAATLSNSVDGIRSFRQADSLDLDMVFPATQIFEAPFGAPWAGWIPDWQCKHLPDLFDPLETARRDLHYGVIATRSPFLVLSSEMAIADSRRLFGERLVDHGKLPFAAVLDPEEVAHARALVGAVRQKFGLADRYFLVANQWWVHKNHEVVLNAVSRITDDALQVVCTGALKDHRWPSYPASLIDSISPSVAKRLKVLGSVDRLEQLALMIGSQAVIQPSRFEGWSTVVEEARTLGVPILLSDIPVHREQAPERGRFFEPDDPTGLAEAMQELQGSNAPVGSAPDTFEHRLRCVRRLNEIAHATKARYDASRHDPVVILAEMTARFAVGDLDDTQRALAAKTFSGTRSMLLTNALALDRYATRIKSLPVAARAILQKQVVVPALSELKKRS